MEDINNIYNIAQQIFNQEPQGVNSIQIDIINNVNPAILFEILSILMCECLEIKLPNILRNNHNISQFILNIKQYFHSFGMNFDYKLINIREHGGDFRHSLVYQTNRSYIFEVKTEFLYYDLLIPYEPDIHITNELNNFKLLIKIREQIYQITFNPLR